MFWVTAKEIVPTTPDAIASKTIVTTLLGLVNLTSMKKHPTTVVTPIIGGI